MEYPASVKDCILESEEEKEVPRKVYRNRGIVYTVEQSTNISILKRLQENILSLFYI